MSSVEYAPLDDAVERSDERNERREQDRSPTRQRWAVVGVAAVTVVCALAITLATMRSPNHGSSGSASSPSAGSASLGSQALATALSDETANSDETAHSDWQVYYYRQAHPIARSIPVYAEEGSDPSVDRFRGHLNATTDQHHTFLHYDIEVKKDRMHLEKEKDVLKVTCLNDNKVHIVLKSPEAAANFHARLNPGSTVMTMLKDWGCSKSTIRMVGTNGRINLHGREVEVPTVAAELTHLFKNADVRYCGNGFPTGNTHKQSVPMHMQDGPTRQRRGWFSDLENDISNEFTEIKDDVSSAVKSLEDFKQDVHATATFLKDLYDNNGNYDHTWSPVHQHTSVGPVGLTSKVPVLQGSYNYDFTLEFELQITSYSLTKLKTQLSGDAAAAVTAKGALFSKSLQGSTPTETVFDKKFPTFYIDVGPVPIPVSISASMTAKMTWDIEADVKMDADIKASGNLMYGYEYTPSSEFKPLKSSSMTADAEVNYITATVDAKGSILVNTILKLETFYCAAVSATVALTPIVHATVTETVEGAGIEVNGDLSSLHAEPINPSEPDYSSQCHPTENSNHVDTPSVLATVGTGLRVTAAAAIDIQTFNLDETYDICQGDCYHHVWSKSWCIHP